ncbi:MAG TPA: hypothetical protein DEP72_06855 [Clostridiales bacterium]|nr:MAG: hypothetical protein A2Y18_06245 [Clostridiales bacterium GWD2_32_19]HCC07859.1 hypothetical protein [Clostridiales bacterium]
MRKQIRIKSFLFAIVYLFTIILGIITPTQVQADTITQFTKTAVGVEHTVMLKNDGTVWTSGSNGFGQLGDGTNLRRSRFVQVIGLSGITGVAAGRSHTVALKNDGTVWTWGGNSYGQLGDNTTINKTTPVQVSSLTGITAIEAGYDHTIALKSDGTVWAWGTNVDGELGDGTAIQKITPVKVSNLTGVKAVAGGDTHTVALKTDGTVWTWGSGSYGKLGDGSSTSRSIPAQVSSLSGITAISCGDKHTIVLKSDGTVWTFGRNRFGQIGDGTITNRTTPYKLTSITGITAISGGGDYTTALKSDGTVWSWGFNGYGDLGDGTITNRYSPVKTSGLTGIITVKSGYDHTVALKNDGTVWTWGYNDYDQLGYSTKRYKLPIQSSVLSGITAIAGGDKHTVVLKSNGTLWTYGGNSYGQLGDGTTTYKSMPVQVTGLTGMTAIAGGYLHTAALKCDGTVWAWGYNSSGQLGDGTTTQRTTAVKVSGLIGITSIAAGRQHTVALKNDGTVWTWGYNGGGQLGDGTTTKKLTPVQASGLTGVIAIASGSEYTIALKNDGTVWTWGKNSSGQLGDGTTTNKLTPIKVSELNGITAISGGRLHAVALKSGGTVWTWGQNMDGQLGDGTTTQRNTPAQVSELAGIIGISGGEEHTVALKSDGTVWTFGSNSYGQLGDGTTLDRTITVQVRMLSEIIKEASGYLHTIALKNYGTVWTWGNNEYGQLGIGKSIIVTYPTQITNVMPQIVAKTPTSGQVFTENDTAFIPQLTVSDVDDDVFSCKYYIDSETTARDAKSAMDTTAPQDVAFNSFNMNTLSEGTHSIKYEVSDWMSTPVTTTISFKVDKSAPTITLTPSSTTNSITLNASATDNIAGLATYPYRYTVGSNDSSWVNQASYTQNSLLPNKEYTVELDVQDSVGHIGSQTQKIWTKAIMPSVTVSNATATSLTVNANDTNPTDTEYQIATGSNYVTQTGELTTTPTWITLNNKKMVATGLSSNTLYTFSIVAKCGDGTVTQSSSGTGTTLVPPPETPIGLTSTSINNVITVSWTGVSEMTYTVNVDDGEIITSVGPFTSYIHTGLNSGEQHTYKIKATNAGGDSDWSTSLTAVTKLDIPSNITATSTATSMTLAWSEVNNATSYDVNVDGVTINTSNTTTTVSGLTAGEQHTYSIRAKNDVATSDWSSQNNKLTRITVPGVPTNVEVDENITSIELIWDEVEDATTYQVSVDGNIINNGTGTIYVDTGLTPDTEHTYMVRAVNSGGKSVWSNQVIGHTKALDPKVPSNLAATATSDSVNLTWSEVTDATGYDLSIEQVNGDGTSDTRVETVTDATYTSLGLTVGTVLVCKVRSTINGETSSWSPSITVTVGGNIIGVPQNIEITPTNNAITMSWDKVIGATSYEIEENSNVVGNSRGLTYSHEGLTASTEYTYRVRAVNSSGVGEWSDQVITTTLENPPLSIPGNIIATPTMNTISLVWDTVDGAASYDIEIDDTTTQNVTNNIYTISGLDASSTHTFRVRAVSDSQAGSYSSVLSAMTLATNQQTPPQGTASVTYTANVVSGDDAVIVMTASDIQNLNARTFTVIYNPDQLDIEDLCATTSDADTTMGDIKDTELSISEPILGTLVFTLKTSVIDGQSFTGLVNVIKFNSKISGQTNVTYTIN